MKPFPIIGLLALVVPTFALAAADAPSRPHEAIFDYSMGSLAQGEIQGDCKSQAAVFAPEASGFSFEASGGLLEHYTTEFNVTGIEPKKDSAVWIPLDAKQTREDQTVGTGHGAASWSQAGKARIFGEGWPFERTDGTVVPFDATYEVGAMRSGVLSDKINAGTFYAKHQDVVWAYIGGVKGTNRVVDLSEGSVHVQGNVTVYLDGAQIDLPDGASYQTPEYRENVTSLETDLVGYYRVRIHHVLLRLTDARISLEAEQVDFACSDGHARLHGSLLAYQAKGRVQAGNESRTFERQELALQGAMEYEESVPPLENGRPGSVQFAGQGQFTAVDLDFANTGIVSGSFSPWVEASLWALLVAAAAGAVGYAAKSLWPLYTRLEKPVLLDRVTRTHVVDALRSAPWMSVAELQRSTGLGRSTVRYQLAVLARHGLVRSRPTVWGSKYAVRVEGAAAPAPPTDPVEALLRRESGSAPMRLSILMRLIQAEQSASRSGAWYTIQNSVRAGLVSLERRDGRVWAQCSSKA